MSTEADPKLPFRVAADVPITRVETLNDWQRSRLIGAMILNRHWLLGTFDQLKPGATAVLFAMATFHGQVTDGRDGLVVNVERDKIAKSIGFEIRSINQPILQLEELRVIRINRFSRPNTFELLMPAEPFDCDPDAWRALSAKTLTSVVVGNGEPLTDTDLRRATSVLALYSAERCAPPVSLHSPVSLLEFGKSDSQPPIEVSRATSVVVGSPLNNDFNNDINITGGSSEQDGEKLAVIAELHAIGVPPKRVAQFARTITLREAVAVRIHLSRIKDPSFNKVGLGIKKLNDPGNEIPKKDLEEADRELAPSKSPAPTAASLQINEERAFEAKVDRTLAELSEGQLADMQRQAAAMARTDAGRKAVLNSDPRKHPLVRSIVRSTLQQAATAARDELNAKCKVQSAE